MSSEAEIKNMSADEFTLTNEEIKKITGYSKPLYQLMIFKELGIPARRRPDNSLLVMRMHCLTPVLLQASDGPKLKSSRK